MFTFPTEAAATTATTTNSTKEGNNDSKMSIKEKEEINDDDDDDDTKMRKLFTLPTRIDLSIELCKIVDHSHYSRIDDSMQTLGKLLEWADTEDKTFLQNFDAYGGVLKLLDFIQTTLVDEETNKNDGSGTICMGCIGKAACCIANVIYLGEDNTNLAIATKMATTLVNYNGIQTLLIANNVLLLISTDDTVFSHSSQHLDATKAIWGAFKNITYIVDKDVMKKEQAIDLFDSAMRMIRTLVVRNYTDHDIDTNDTNMTTASNTARNMFDTLTNLVLHNYITKEEFKDKEALSKCLKAVAMVPNNKKNNNNNDNNKNNTTPSSLLLKSIIVFLQACSKNDLLEHGNASDYESIVPLCVSCLKECSTNPTIRTFVVDLLTEACNSSNNNNKMIEKAGALEALSLLVTSIYINEDEKKNVRSLIVKICATQ